MMLVRRFCDTSFLFRRGGFQRSRSVVFSDWGSERSFGGGRAGGSFFKGDEGGTGNEAEDGDGATGEERFEVQPVGPGDFF